MYNSYYTSCNNSEFPSDTASSDFYPNSQKDPSTATDWIHESYLGMLQDVSFSTDGNCFPTSEVLVMPPTSNPMLSADITSFFHNQRMAQKETIPVRTSSNEYAKDTQNDNNNSNSTNANNNNKCVPSAFNNNSTFSTRSSPLSARENIIDEEDEEEYEYDYESDYSDEVDYAANNTHYNPNNNNTYEKKASQMISVSSSDNSDTSMVTAPEELQVTEQNSHEKISVPSLTTTTIQQTNVTQDNGKKHKTKLRSFTSLIKKIKVVVARPFRSMQNRV